MKWTFNLMRVRGIEIKIHLTFLLILALGGFEWGRVHGAPGVAFGVLVMLAQIAVFIFIGAGMESFQAKAKTVLTTRRIGDAYNKHALTLNPNDRVSTAVDYILTSRGAFPRAGEPRGSRRGAVDLALFSPQRQGRGGPRKSLSAPGVNLSRRWT
jgi:hypothetical protein